VYRPVFVGDAYTLARVLDLRGRLNGHNKVSSRIHVREVRGLRVARIDVRHCTVRRVRSNEEVPVIEEIVAGL
jgi:hypothetical protein